MKNGNKRQRSRDKDKKTKKINHKQEVTIVSNFEHKILALKYIKQILTELKGEVISSTIIVGDFNTQLSTMERSSRQRINKKTADLKIPINQTEI